MNIYLIGPDDADYEAASTAFAEKNMTAYYPATPKGNELRMRIAMLTHCDTVSLMDGWWSSSDGLILQNIAAWLRMGVVDQEGHDVPTSSLRG